MKKKKEVQENAKTIPVEARFSAPVLLYSKYSLSFPGVKRSGRGVNHPPQSSAEIKERVELYLYSPSGPSWPVLVQTLTPLHDVTIARKTGSNKRLNYGFPQAVEFPLAC